LKPDHNGDFQWAFQGGNSAYGWSYELPYLTGKNLVTEMWLTTINGNPPQFVQHQCDGASYFVFRGFDGGQYALGLAGGSWNDPAYQGTNPNDCIDQSPYDAVTSSNNHGILATYPSNYTGWPNYPPVTVVDQSGTTYQFPGGSAGGVSAVAQTITDRNGNQITVSGNSYKDTLGRTVISWDNPLGYQPPNHITVSGLSSNIVVQFGSIGGANYPMSGHELSGTANCTVPTTGPPTGNYGITEIDLPNGQSYKFTYNSTYGTISQIQFPDGGSVRYTWGLNHSGAKQFGQWWFNSGNGYQSQNSCTIVYDVPVITDRWVKDGTRDVLHQVFSYCESWITSCPSAYKTTTVTSHDLVSGSTSATTYSYGAACPDQVPFAPNCPGSVALEVQVVNQDGSGNTLRTQYQQWQDAYVASGSQTVLDNGQTMTELRCYDTNEQLTNFYEYGFPSEGSYPGDPSCVSSSGTPASKGPLRRQTTTTYHAFASGTHIVDAPDSVTVADGSGSTAKQTNYTYTDTVQASGTDSALLVAPPGTDRGNIASISKLISTGNWATTTYGYFDTGQVQSVTDPCGHTSCSDISGSNHRTTYLYTDNFASGTGTAPGQTNAYLTQVTDPLGHRNKFAWGYNDGLIRSATDPNNQITSYQYSDPLLRLTNITYPDNGQTTVTYNDSTYSSVNNTPNFTITKVVSNSPSVNLVTTTAFDGLGQAVRTLLTSDPDGTDTTDIGFEGLGRVRTTSNPYRSAPSTSDGTATTSYDALGRVKSVAEPDGSSVNTTYSGQCTTTTDETGKSRQSCTDGLGRLVQVFEDPAGLNYETDYTYDTLDNLSTVTQKGGTTNSALWRSRSFNYDMLSRLTQAINPESGTIKYTDDANGNVTSKVAPLPNQTSSSTVTTNYQYDVLNRLLNKTYVGMSTASPTYGYDGIAPTGCTPPTLTDSYPIGRRTSMCDGSGATSWAHDTMGRIKTENRKVSTTTREVSYGYNLDGSLASLTYPTGRIVKYVPGGAGHPLSATDSTGPIDYVSAAHYAPFGGLTSMTMGSSPITVTNGYSNRLQPVLLSASTTAATILSLCYDFHLQTSISIGPCSISASSSGDNGNVFQIVNNRDGSRTQNFLYDPLNRIWQAYTNGSNWGETYSPNTLAAGTAFSAANAGIDAWGNLTNRSPVTGKTNYENLSCPANTQNQLTTCSLTYDAAGNVITNAVANYTYDAENRIATASGATYLYDGDGNRMARVFSTGNLYWRDLGGNTLLEDSDGGTNLREYIYFNGQRVSRRDVTSNTVHYMFADHLGSTSLITDALGTMSSCNGHTSGQFESDYYPYGGEQSICADLGDQNYKFTGKERDSETNLDYFGARYYGSNLGRFMTPDWAAKPISVPYANFGNPQSLNLYSYVQNNPTTFGDPDGHGCPPQCAVETPTAKDWQLIKDAGERALAGAEDTLAATAARISVGATVLTALYAASPFVQEVGQSDADEKARIEQASKDRKEQNGGVDPQHQDQTQENQTETEPQTSTSGGQQGSGGSGKAGKGTKDRGRDFSQQGTVDQLRSIEKDKKKKNINSTKKSEQNVDNANKKIKSSDDVEEMHQD
jgi:RHS repeat-associated protein